MHGDVLGCICLRLHPSGCIYQELSLHLHFCFITVLVRVTVFYDETPCKWNLGRKGFMWLILPHWSPSLKEVRIGGHAGLECGGRSWCRACGGLLLTGVLSLLCRRAQDHLNRVGTTHSGLDTPHQSLTKKVPHQLALSPVSWRHFLSWGSLCSTDSSLC